MAQPVYSTRFMRAALSAGASTFTVPAGYVCILRDVDAVITGGTGAAFAIFDDAGVYLLTAAGIAGGNSVLQWRGRQVFNAGETITAAESGGGEAFVHMSGYLLTE